jgi:ABC-type oligopeptide transport system substrate-binding subunit
MKLVETIDRSKPGWREKLISNNYYDIRISSVDTGANFLKEGIEMMFCTKLGVSFPDPNNKVCNLIKNVFDTDVKNQEYGQIFEDIIEKQAAVIPLFHSGVLWLQSTDLLPLTPSIGTNHPRFDNLQLNYDSK